MLKEERVLSVLRQVLKPISSKDMKFLMDDETWGNRKWTEYEYDMVGNAVERLMEPIWSNPIIKELPDTDKEEIRLQADRMVTLEFLKNPALFMEEERLMLA